MHHGCGDEAHKRFEGRVEHGALHVMSMRVGAVEDHERDVGLRARLHDQHQGADVRVETGADVLDVKHHDVNVGKLFRLRLAVLAMQRIDGEPCGRVGAVEDVCPVRCFAAEPVFGGKHVADVNPLGKQGVHEVDVADHAGVVADHGDALGLEPRQVDVHLGVAEHDVLAMRSGNRQAEKKQGQAQFVHELEDALGDGGVGFGRGNVVNGVPALAGQHGVKTLQELRIVLQHLLQVGRNGHAVFAVIHAEVDVNPPAKRGLGLLQFLFGDHHKPTAVARAEEATMPGHPVVDRDDEALGTLAPNLVGQCPGQGEKVHVALPFKAFDLC